MSYEETYTGEFKIKNEVGKNLLETYEVNGRAYTDNLPKNCFISIPKKQYIEYEQQKEENQRLNNIIKEVREEIRMLESNCDISNYQAQKLFQILDKGDKDND